MTLLGGLREKPHTHSRTSYPSTGGNSLTLTDTKKPDISIWLGWLLWFKTHLLA